ncbi:hypothetical protein BGZ47_005249 [Haplosporangium gracile]|nr:hypothetical protein BGZ47_005249 [Haplosporangium gracile]
MDNAVKGSSTIKEVVLLGPVLNREHYHKLLSCFTDKFDQSVILDVDLLQGLVQLVHCAGPDYLHSDDLVRILTVLRTRLQEAHQQTAKHPCPYYLTLALSRLLDVMVEGKVQDLSRVVDHEPLSALLGQLKKSEDIYLKHQAAYALQALLYIPNDESRRQCVLKHGKNITMGLLGVASVCKLDFSNITEGTGKIYDAAMETIEIATKMVHGAQLLFDGGQGLLAAMKGGILSGGRKLWYAALREAQEHIRSGRLADFNRFVFEAPCRRDVEFQWGICLYLGEIAVDEYWEEATRQHALDFLAELYKNESNLTSGEEVDKWILHIVRQVSALPEPAISGHAQQLLQSLEKEGNAVKQELYRDCMSGSCNTYIIKVRMSEPMSSTLLSRIQAIPDVEYHLHRLRQNRFSQHQKGVYIPPQAKPSLQSKDDTLFPLMEKVQEFLSSHRKVLLLLGDSGAGKSTFNLELEHILWKKYKNYGPIPLHITLPTIDNPAKDLIGKQLRCQNFSEEHIRELKLRRQFIVICDGYDESQLKTNLYSSNEFNRPGQWKVKMVVSCRSQYLGQEYRSRFQPLPTDHYVRASPDLMMEAVIAPFSEAQIEQYVEQYVEKLPADDVDCDRPAWTKEEYMERLTKIPKLPELVSNPFLLTLSLEALPEVIGSKKELSAIRITRVQLYDGFVNRWIEVNKRRLNESTLSESERSAFDVIFDDDFLYRGIEFQKKLAAAIFQKQEGQPVVRYTHLHDRSTWKYSFFSPVPHIKLLRESSTVTRSGGYFRFIHRTLLEYFYSRTIYDPLDRDIDIASDDSPSASTVKSGLVQRSIVNEPSIVHFLAERVDSDHLFKAQLLEAVEDSKMDARAGVGAANAISILVKAGYWFHGADLRSIRIPGADLRGGLFDSVDFEGADLSNVNLGKAWLRQANLNKTNMLGVQFGELPYLVQQDAVARCVYSSDGKLLAVSTDLGPISTYETATWTKVPCHFEGKAIAFSPNNQELAVGLCISGDVELSDILTGKPRLVLYDHEGETTCISYSPDVESQIATSSGDSIQIWSTESGARLHVLSKHTAPVTGVSFSSTGLQLASCSYDWTVRIWDAKTGDEVAILIGHTDLVCSRRIYPTLGLTYA